MDHEDDESSAETARRARWRAKADRIARTVADMSRAELAGFAGYLADGGRDPMADWLARTRAGPTGDPARGRVD